VKVRDLESRNGTLLDGVEVERASLRVGSLLRLGRTAVRFDPTGETARRRLSERARFGSLVGTSVPMRATYALLERAADCDATVLLEGETGTGKGAAADSIHQASKRRDRPFVVVDCGALTASLLESDLFGHERGAFTGADTRRIGAFEEADGGTLFLDEIGELPADLQPKLLRVLENRQVRRLGQNAYQSIDVRTIAATHRDLRAEVNAGRFRADLYFRLAVLKVNLPPLRQRPEDLRSLVAQLLISLHASPDAIADLTTAVALDGLGRAAWPGNVRELRNHLERCLAMQDRLPVEEARAEPDAGAPAIDPAQPYAEARERAIAQFERAYAAALLRHHDDNVTAASRAAGIARIYLHRLLRRHRLR